MFTDLFKLHRTAKWGALATRRIEIKGMTCKNCERTVKKALLTKSGVKQIYLNRETGVAEVTFDTDQVTVEALGEVILRKGYFPTVLGD